MRRRNLVDLLGIAAFAFPAWPLSADAQQSGKIMRVGVLTDEGPSLAAKSFEPIAQGLRDFGWVEGQNVAFEARSSNGKEEALPGLAAELVRLQPDIIVAVGTPAARAAETATETIPIVFTRVSDPIGLGLVTSLARPSGNVTGVSLLATDLATKWLDFLIMAVSDARRVGVLWDVRFPASRPRLKEIEAAAQSLNLEVVPADVRGPDDFQPALAAIIQHRAGAVIVLPSPVFAGHLRTIAELTAKAQLATMFGRREHVDAGGLMSYGTNYPAMYRRAAACVDKILKGAKPADLPVEQPTKFELVINLRTAQSLGLTIPPILLGRADEVIE